MQLDLTSDREGNGPRLLGQDDPDPVIYRQRAGRIVLTVEHAGRAVPAALSGLGLPQSQIDRHIGWDIGALDLALRLSQICDATLVAQRYSRLAVDCNRPWGSPDLVPEVSDQTAIPGNTGLSAVQRQARWDEIHTPFHDAVSHACDQGAAAVVAVHSYDPQRESDDGVRPWPVGLLFRTPNALADGLRVSLSTEAHALPLGLNQPYEIEDDSDYTIPVHGEARGLPHVLIEVRNDYLRDAAGLDRMARILSKALTMAVPI